MNSYKYLVYDYIIETNYNCPYLAPASGIDYKSYKKIKLLINKENMASKSTDNSRFLYNIINHTFQGVWKNILFVVDWINFMITISSVDIDEAFLFALNVPLSLLLSYDNRLILHCSCACEDDLLIGFSGCKGIGKSTICSIFSSSNNRVFFSDDTICIDIIRRKVFSNYSVEKYTQKTIDILNSLAKFPTDYISVYNHKTIRKLDYSSGPKKLDKFSINYLYRGNSFVRVNDLSKNAKMELLKNNIVGYRYADYQLRTIIDNNVNNLFDTCDVKSSILYTPYMDLSTMQHFLCELEDTIFAQ